MIAKFIVPIVATIFICGVCQNASAGFVQNPNRNDSNGFPGFFLSRLSTWALEKIDLGFLSANEKLYVEMFAKSATSFGVRSPSGFVRAFDLALTGIKGGKIEGSLRLLDVTNRKDLTDLALKIIRARAPKLDLKQFQGKTIGLGFSAKSDGFEILVGQERLMKIKILNVAKNGSTTTNDFNVGAKVGEAPPGAVRSALQTDTMTDDHGHAAPSWQIDQFEALALLPDARRIYEFMWSTFNINPGAMMWVSPKDYALIYP